MSTIVFKPATRESRKTWVCYTHGTVLRITQDCPACRS